jgi:hypothetical protein
MIINRANLAALNVTFSGVYQSAFERADNFSDKLVTKVPCASNKGIYGFASTTGGVRKWVGKRTSIALNAHSYELPHEKFEQTLSVPRDAIVRDTLGVFTSMYLPAMADAVKKHPDQELASAVFAANPDGFDGVPYWSASHPTFRGSGLYSNDFELDASTLESLSEELARVRASMMTITGEDGILLKTNHTVIATPVAQEMRLRKVVKSATIPVPGSGAGVDNPLNGLFDLIVIPELDLIDPTTIYTLDLSKPLKPFLWQIGSNPIFRSFTDDPNNMHAFEFDEYVYGIDGDNGAAYEANAGVTLPFLSARCKLDLPT